MFYFKAYKMNEMVNKFLLIEDKFMPEMHLKQPGFTYGACALFTKNKERIEKFMVTGNTDFIYRNDLDKVIKEDQHRWFTRFSIKIQWK